MPDWLYNYFVKYNRTFLARGILAPAVVTAVVGYRYVKDPELSLPIPMVIATYGFFAAFIAVGLYFRGKTPR